MRRRWIGYAAAAAAAAAATAAAGGVSAAGPAAHLVALDKVTGGRWTIHEIGRPETTRTLCVAAPAQLLQLRHGPRACARFVLDARPARAIVQYSCPGAGYGRTTFTVETPTLLRLQTQGIADGQPFDMDVEARRIGTC